MVVVFYRDATLHFGDLVCSRTATFPTGVTRVPNDDETLASFVSFIAGFAITDPDTNKAVHFPWRKICRAFCKSKDDDSEDFIFSSPSVMVVLNQHATKLSELTAQVSLVEEPRKIKNSLARLRLLVLIVKPIEIQQIQQCVHWAIKYDLNLTVLGGSHSGQCIVRIVCDCRHGCL